MGLTRDLQRETRELVVRCERELPVSELEKTQVRLGYLMELLIKESDNVRAKLKEVAGDTEAFAELGEANQAALGELAVSWGLHSGRVLFWMWRSWLMGVAEVIAIRETDPAKAPTDENTLFPRAGVDHRGYQRDAVEELSFSDEHSAIMTGARDRAKILTRKIAKLKAMLGQAALQAEYALSGSSGSPLAVLLAAQRLHRSEAGWIELAIEELREAYGFSPHHKPNKRLDRHTVRNLDLFFYWHRDEYAEVVKRYGLTKNMADKIASRVAAELPETDVLLAVLEEEENLPTVVFARRLRRPESPPETSPEDSQDQP